MAGPVSQVQTDGQPRLFQNLLSPRRHSATLFHKPVSFPLRLERVNRWERIASRWRPAFSSHLINGILPMWGTSSPNDEKGGLIRHWGNAAVNRDCSITIFRGLIRRAAFPWQPVFPK